ncbi:MAG TPA: type II secretion system inner membrane protein GspF [Planctomycetota bacterium]|nr:type II secretion system inner membrane protein GspF [Planctomycetota bacterium]
MPVYTYKALKEDGGSDGGVIDADSPKDARLKLKGRRLHVTDLAPVEETRGGGGGARSGFRLFRRRRPQEIAMLTRQLATLLGSGIPMIGAMTAIIDQTEHRDMKTSLMGIREKVSQGGSLSDAMAAHPVYFNDLYVNMVRAGEAGGNLDKVLFRVADYLHSQNRTRAKVVASLTYPIIMLVIGVGVVAVLLTYVVPKILEVIKKQGKAALPLPTEILVLVSGFMGRYWWLLLSIAIGTAYAYWQARQTPAGRLWTDTMKLRIPVVGNLIKKAAISRFAITFATLLESGLPVLEAMGVVKRVVDNALLAETLEMVRQKIAEGADIATPLKNSKVFPPVVGYMIGVGEESGRLEELLKKTAEAYDEEVDVAAQKMTALLEPLMIVIMAVVVGFIVLSILLPILQMSNI